MTVRANKPAFNIREKLKELTHSIGLKGRELMRAATVQEARDLVSAGRKNLIINGDMRISQRYGFNNPITVTNANGYYLDRFVVRNATGGTFTARQSSHGTPFHNALQLNVTVVDTSIATNEYARIQYHVEGHDATALDWGNAGAKDHLTLSFWVKTNAPGTYNVSIENSSSFYFPIMVKKYVVKTANVWQKVVVTFPPPSGTYTFERGNGIGFKFTWCLVSGDSYDDATDGVYRTSGYMMATTAGQRNWMDTVGNDFYLTGVQAEIGKNSTDFEYRSYGEELALCQRYYYQTKVLGTQYNGAIMGFGMSQNRVSMGSFRFPTPMRTYSSAMITMSRPSDNVTNGAHRFMSIISGSDTTASDITFTTFVTAIDVGPTGFPYFNTGGNVAVGAGYLFHITADAEL